ncbi:hypothetical protein Bca4012_027703 [Brassica carinata]|uniref:Uncharacterized protein n=1 Tax=Brassica carinata TaxID=52824 RepID=A0A8X7VKZ7_BRACI|nr:hypothetical protein Bca52824_024686 [Brassica carinata]
MQCPIQTKLNIPEPPVHGDLKRLKDVGLFCSPHNTTHHYTTAYTVTGTRQKTNTQTQPGSFRFKLPRETRAEDTYLRKLETGSIHRTSPNFTGARDTTSSSNTMKDKPLNLLAPQTSMDLMGKRCCRRAI